MCTETCTRLFLYGFLFFLKYWPVECYVGTLVLHGADRRHCFFPGDPIQSLPECGNAFSLDHHVVLCAELWHVIEASKNAIWPDRVRTKALYFLDNYNCIYFETTLTHESSRIYSYMHLMTAHTHFSHGYCINYAWERLPCDASKNAWHRKFNSGRNIRHGLRPSRIKM